MVLVQCTSLPAFLPQLPRLLLHHWCTSHNWTFWNIADFCKPQWIISARFIWLLSRIPWTWHTCTWWALVLYGPGMPCNLVLVPGTWCMHTMHLVSPCVIWLWYVLQLGLPACCSGLNLVPCEPLCYGMPCTLVCLPCCSGTGPTLVAQDAPTGNALAQLRALCSSTSLSCSTAEMHQVSSQEMQWCNLPPLMIPQSWSQHSFFWLMEPKYLGAVE